MDAQPALPSESVPHCNYCKSPVAETDVFCQQCGFPLQGTEDEKHHFHHKMGFKKMQLQETNDEIRKGTNSLYVVAGFFGVYSIVYYFMNDRLEGILPVVITNLVLAAVFVILALWSVQKPVAALISGLSLYVAVQLFNTIVEPFTLFKGIIIKVFIIIYLVKALQSALGAQKLSKALKVK